MKIEGLFLEDGKALEDDKTLEHDKTPEGDKTLEGDVLPTSPLEGDEEAFVYMQPINHWKERNLKP